MSTEKTRPDNIYARLAAAVAAMPAVGKDGENKHHRFAYRSIESIVAATRKALAANGLTLSPADIEVIRFESFDGGNRRQTVCVLRVDYRLGCDTGETITISSMGEGVDSGDKATGKAMTFAYKTALSQLLAISSEADPDGESPERIAPAQSAPAEDRNGSAPAAEPHREPTVGTKLREWLIAETAARPEVREHIPAIVERYVSSGKAEDVKDRDHAREIAKAVMELLAD